MFIVGQVPHKAGINFQRRNRQFSQVRKLREAGSKIIQRERDSQFPQFVHTCFDPTGAFEDGRLGQFKFDASRIRTAASNNVFHDRDKSIILYLGERDVYRHIYIVQFLFLKPYLSAAGVLNDLVTNGLHQPHIFASRNKLSRCHQASLRIIPAQQCLQPYQLSGSKVNPRLIMQLKLIRNSAARELFPAISNVSLSE